MQYLFAIATKDKMANKPPSTCVVFTEEEDVQLRVSWQDHTIGISILHGDVIVANATITKRKWDRINDAMAIRV